VPPKAKADDAKQPGAKVARPGSGKTIKEAMKPTRKTPKEVEQLDEGLQEHLGIVEVSKLEMEALDVPQPPVRPLSYGLDRVLFNSGVYRLQDNRSKVYNFDPYLEKIMPVEEFNFAVLKGFVTSSKDTSLREVARQHEKRYMSSSSGMTTTLAHFHFLLSSFRGVNNSMMSRAFPVTETHSDFTSITKAPSVVFLRWKDGVYAMDTDKEFADTNVLSLLGQSLEKLLTLDRAEYEQYRKGAHLPVEKSKEGESYHYSAVGNFLMRSQLDAHDSRLPGTGMFDLKTRVVLPVRMDVQNFKEMRDYELRQAHGQFESYEREFLDMVRATMLKYSLQVRIGRMDGIFVAYHNTQRMFGFQYIPVEEMDLSLHGQSDRSLGDQEFRLSVNLLNEVLDKATARFPEQSLRLHFETKGGARSPNMHIFVEPVTEEQADEIQNMRNENVERRTRELLDGVVEEDSEDIPAAAVNTAQTAGASDVIEDATEATEEVVNEVGAQSQESAEDQTMQGGNPSEEPVLATTNQSYSIIEPKRDATSVSPAPEQQPNELFEEAELLSERDVQASGPSDADAASTLEMRAEKTEPILVAGRKEASGDGAFLQTVDAEMGEAAARSPESPILALQLTVRNYVNGVPVSRPGQTSESSSTQATKPKGVDESGDHVPPFSAKDKWTVKYSLKELSSQKAWSLYSACQKRRKEMLDPDDKKKQQSMLYFRRMLKEWADKGKKYRAVRDEADKDLEKVMVRDQR